MPMTTSDHGSATSVSPFIRATQNYPQNVLIMSGSAFSHASPKRLARHRPLRGRRGRAVRGQPRSFSPTAGSLVLILFVTLMINHPESIRGGWKDRGDEQSS